MVSTLAITSIFLQIFVAGISVSAAYSFVLRYFQSKKKEDYYLTLIFVSFAIFAALTVVSQIIYTLGQSTGPRFLIYRIISINQVAGALFIAYLIKEKFSYKENFIFKAFLVSCFVEIFLIIKSPLNLVEHVKDIAMEPGGHYLSAIPPEIFWVALWLVIGIQYLIAARATKDQGEKNIYNLPGVSSVLIIISFILTFSYAKTGESYLLGLAWALYLLAATGFFVGNIINPKSDVAKFPTSYFRTRILYKLVIIFILLIVILLEVTTIATINLNQISMEKAITGNYQNIAKSAADKIEYLSSTKGVLDKAFIQNIVNTETKGKRYVYVVSSNGKLYAAPDEREEGRDLNSVSSVQKALAGLYGSDVYQSEFFDKPEDRTVLAAYAPVKRYKLGVIVEEPQWQVYSEIRLVSTNTLIFVIVGIILTVSVGIFFAKSIEKSIKDVISGTEAVKKGDLSYRIKISSIDEIGQLADAFNQMTKKLKQDQDSLVASEKLASLGTMAAGMAHEIKNPLVSLRTFTQLLPQRYEDEEFRKKFSTIVPQEIDKINKIAESLLRFGRPHKPELTEVNVNEMLEEILALFDNEARKNNVRVTTKLADLPKITADAGQLSQAFVNIILNGIQAMQGGGELTVKTDVGEIVKLGQGLKEGEEEARQQPSIFIEISDTGVGIPEENKNKIFDPFFTTKEVGGTGMGLPITRRIIEEHHGSIRLTSKIGKGTTFFVSLPVSLEIKA
jgi:signal transduction histidine kinase